MMTMNDSLPWLFIIQYVSNRGSFAIERNGNEALDRMASTFPLSNSVRLAPFGELQDHSIDRGLGFVVLRVGLELHHDPRLVPKVPIWPIAHRPQPEVPRVPLLIIQIFQQMLRDDADVGVGYFHPSAHPSDAAHGKGRLIVHRAFGSQPVDGRVRPRVQVERELHIVHGYRPAVVPPDAWAQAIGPLEVVG